MTLLSKRQRYLCPVCRAGGASYKTDPVPICHKCYAFGDKVLMVTGVNHTPDDPNVRARWTEEDQLEKL